MNEFTSLIFSFKRYRCMVNSRYFTVIIIIHQILHAGISRDRYLTDRFCLHNKQKRQHLLFLSGSWVTMPADACWRLLVKDLATTCLDSWLMVVCGVCRRPEFWKSHNLSLFTIPDVRHTHNIHKCINTARFIYNFITPSVLCIWPKDLLLKVKPGIMEYLLILKNIS